MRFRIAFALLIVAGWATTIARAQTALLLDSESGEPVSFAYAKAWRSRQTTFSDLDGKVTFANPFAVDSVTVELIGYEPLSLVTTAGLPDTLWMNPSGVNLEDVVITPGENPALRIMRRAVERRQINHVLNQEGYHYSTYNKLKLSPAKGGTLPDSNLLREMDLFLMETATEIWTLSLGRTFEQVRASKVSGYPGKSLPLTAGDLQSVTPYDNYVQVISDKFLSPLSPQGLDRYIFEWTDTLLQGADSIFVIRCVPRKGDWNGLDGVVQIHSRGFAVVNLDMRLVIRESPLLASRGSIRQQYISFEDSLWVPSQLLTELELLPYNKQSSFHLSLSGRSDLTGFGRYDRLPRKPDGVEVQLLPQAGSQHDSIRIVPLTARERRTYELLDSIGKEVGLNWWFDQIYLLQEGRLGLGPLQLDLEHLFTSNRVERWRLGLGVTTSDKLWRRASIGGWAMYGGEKGADFDTRLKWGAELRVTPLGDRRIVAGAGLRTDLVETGMPRMGHPASQPLWRGISRMYDTRTYFLSRMDYVQERFAFLAVDLPGHVSLRADLRQGSLRTAYAYQYQGDSLFTTEDLSLVLRWAPGERFSEQSGHRMLVRNQLPVLMLRAGQGFLQGDSLVHRYQLGEVLIDHRFTGPWQMGIRYHLQAGTLLGNLPLSRLYTFRGNRDRSQQTDVEDTFNTMGVQEFSAKDYAAGWLELSPKLTWLGVGRWRPRLTLSCGAAWGRLPAAEAAQHLGVALAAPQEIYWEPGLTANHLFPASRRETLLSGVLKALSLGVYYRAGKNRNPDWPVNLAFRVGFRL